MSCGEHRSSLPPLPELGLSALEPTARSSVQEALRRAESNSTNAEAVGRLGMFLQANLLLEPARQCYLRASALEPDSFQWHYYLAATQVGTGLFREAVESYGKALKLDPAYLPARSGLAFALLESGESARSQSEYESILSAEPASAPARYGLGRALEAQNDMDGAIEAYLRALEEFPSFGAAHYALALAYRDRGNGRDSERHLELYRRHTASSPRVEDHLMVAVRQLGGSFELVRQGVEHTNAGRLVQAESAFRRALVDRSAALDAHVNLIVVYTRMGRFEDGAAHYASALGINPESEDAHFNYAVLLAIQERNREAASIFEKALEINSLNAEAHLNLGYLYESDRRAAEAEASYRSAVSLEPNHGGANFRLGRLILQRGETEEAISRFEAALASENEHKVQAHYGLATAHAIAGNLPKAVEVAGGALRRAQAEGNEQLARLIALDIERWQGVGSR